MGKTNLEKEILGDDLHISYSMDGLLELRETKYDSSEMVDIHTLDPKLVRKDFKAGDKLKKSERENCIRHIRISTKVYTDLKEQNSLMETMMEQLSKFEEDEDDIVGRYKW